MSTRRSEIAALTEKVADLTERVRVLESKKAPASKQRTTEVESNDVQLRPFNDEASV